MTEIKTKRKITLSDQDPLSFIPHGDRLLIELLEVDETLASGITIVRQDEKGKEFEVGWTAGVVVNVGNGHRLDVPDQAVAFSTEIEKDDDGKPKNVHPYLVLADTATNTGVAMVPSTVPMPFYRGQVVMLAKFAGSDILLQNREHKIITQAHVLGVFSKMKINVGEPQIRASAVPCANPEPDLSLAVEAAAAYMNQDSLDALKVESP